MNLLCATHTLAPLCALSAQILTLTPLAPSPRTSDVRVGKQSQRGPFLSRPQASRVVLACRPHLQATCMCLLGSRARAVLAYSRLAGVAVELPTKKRAVDLQVLLHARRMCLMGNGGRVVLACSRRAVLPADLPGQHLHV